MWTEACALIDRAERLHRQFFQPSFAALQIVGWEPPVDVFETERELWIICALPCVEHQDLEVSIVANTLRVADATKKTSITFRNLSTSISSGWKMSMMRSLRA
jgi:HSP20 family protein